MSKVRSLIHDLILRIELRDTHPLVWRQVVVPEGISLPLLHRVIQESMGWLGGHLHEFDIGGKRYGIVDPDWDTPDLRDEEGIVLIKILGSRRSFDYVYDFGDYWQHRITLEERLSVTNRRSRAECLDGANAGPPEDVGGIPGYYEFVEAMADPGHARHTDMRNWYGQDFDPSKFDLAEVNEILQDIQL